MGDVLLPVKKRNPSDIKIGRACNRTYCFGILNSIFLKSSMNRVQEQPVPSNLQSPH
jgi:hypothetical protein